MNLKTPILVTISLKYYLPNIYGTLSLDSPIFLRQLTMTQGCHNGCIWMKMSVRTSFSSGRPRTSSGRPPASAFTRGRGTTRVRGKNRIYADMVRPRGRTSLPSPLPPSPPLLRPSPAVPVSARTRGCVRADARLCPRGR
jgi:hypothetical protein